MPTFVLHPRLSADTISVADLPASRLLLMNDKQYPWLILVPRFMQSGTTGIREFSDVPAEKLSQVWAEVMAVHHALQQAFHPTKMNVAALGNMVPQLHIHVQARFENDAAWPKPVFGINPPIPYQPSEAGQLVSRIKPHLPLEWLAPVVHE